MHTFLWDRQGSIIQLPVKIVKCVDNGHGITGTLICNDCEKKLSQRYHCDCGKDYTIGEIKKRADEEHGIVYVYQEKKDYLKAKVENQVTVIGETETPELMKNFEFISDIHEIYSNDNVATMKKIHHWLQKHNRVLITSYGHNGKKRSGVIVPTGERLLLVEFRDSRYIRPPKQKDLEPSINDTGEVFKAISVDSEPDLYREYVKKLKEGVKIETKPKEEEKTVKLTATSFLDE